MLDHIKALLKPQDLLDLQAWVDCLLKENRKLKAKAEEGGRRRGAPEGSWRAQEPDRGSGEGGQDCKDRMGQVERGGPEDPQLLGVFGRCTKQGEVI